MRRKIFALMFCFAVIMSLFGTVAVSADEAKLKVTASKTDLKPGDEFDVTVEMSGNPGIYAIYFQIPFDNGSIEFNGDSPYDTSFSGFEVIMNPTDQGYVYFTADNGGNLENSTYNGKLLVVHFKVKSDATNGDYDMKLNLSQDDTFNIDANNVGFSVENAKIKISGGQEPTEPPTAGGTVSGQTPEENANGAVELGSSADGKENGKKSDGKNADGKSADGKSADGKSDKADGSSSDGASALIWIIVAIVAVAAVAVVVVVVMQKKKNLENVNAALGDKKPEDAPAVEDKSADENTADEAKDSENKSE